MSESPLINGISNLFKVLETDKDLQRLQCCFKSRHFYDPPNKIGPSVAQCFYSCQLQLWRLIERKSTLIVMITNKVHV